MSRTKATLAAKIARVMRQVPKIERRGTNDTEDYDYAYATDVFEAVRGKLFNSGILLLPDESIPEYVDRETNGDGLIQECRLSTTFTFTDGAESLPPLKCNGNARDLRDKALYKAQTGAQKAFLKHFGLIAEKMDDPEFDGKPAETLDDVAPAKGLQSRKEQPLREYQIDNIREAMANTEKSAEELAVQVAALGHADQLENVKQKYFKQLFKWASDGRGTIAPPKPQAAPAQPALPLRAATPIEMRIGNQRVEFQPQPKDKPFAI